MSLSFKKIIASIGVFTFTFYGQPAFPGVASPGYLRKLVDPIVHSDELSGNFSDGVPFELRSPVDVRKSVTVAASEKKLQVFSAPPTIKYHTPRRSKIKTQLPEEKIAERVPLKGAHTRVIVPSPVILTPQNNFPSMQNQLIDAAAQSSYLNMALSAPNDPYYSSKGSLYYGFSQLEDLWGLKLLNAESAWQFTKGAGITVAVVDSGVYLGHPDLAGNVWTNTRELNGLPGVDDDGNGFVDDVNGWDFVGNDKDPSDLNGHGTHLAGIIGALADNNKGIAGVAPESKIMAVRVLDSSGSGSFSDVAKGIRYAATMGARIINLSLGASASEVTPTEMTLLTDAIRFARESGAIVVAAAGNSYGDIANQVPARFTDVISVGSLSHAYDTLYGTSSGVVSKSSFSSFGEELDFMAPGVDILSLAVNAFTYAGNKRLSDGTSYYSVSSGTSMAAPMVSGVIALMLAENPLQTFDDIYRRLKFSATDLGPVGFDNGDGWGIVNPFKALSEDYYDNGVVRTRFLSQPDIYDIVRRDYDLSGNLTSQYDQNDDRAVFEYYPGGNVRLVSFYDAQNTFQRSNEYRENGVTLFRRIIANGDIIEYFAGGNRKKFFEASSGNTYEYLDEDFFGNKTGRLTKILRSDGFYTLLEAYYNYKGKDVALYQTDYDPSGRLLVRRAYEQDGQVVPEGSLFEFFSSGILKKYTNKLTSIITEYLDENFYGNGIGRKSRKVYSSGLECVYAYWPGSDQMQSQNILKFGTLQSIDKYRAEGGLDSREYPSGNKISFFSSGNVSQTYFGITGETYSYLDENFFGDHTGRLSKLDLASGTGYSFDEYWPGASTAKVISEYDSSKILVAIYEYGSAGKLIKTTNKYNYDREVLPRFNSVQFSTKGINNQGQIALTGYDGHDREIFLYDGSIMRQLTNNDYNDGTSEFIVDNIKINNRGEIAWIAEGGSLGVDSQVFFYDGLAVKQITNTPGIKKNIGLNDNGAIVWDSVVEGNSQIFLYDGLSTHQLTETSFSNYSPQINNGGQIAWLGNNSTQIFLYDGINTELISTADSQTYRYQNIRLNNNGHLAWQGYFRNVFLFDSISTRQISNSDPRAYFRFNDKDQIAWDVSTSFRTSDVEFYDGYLVKRLTNNISVNDSSNRVDGLELNNNGQLVWDTYFNQGVYAYNGVSVIALEEPFFDNYAAYPVINDGGVISWMKAGKNLGVVQIARPYSAVRNGPPDIWMLSDHTVYSSGRLKSRTLVDGTYYEYRNENFYGNGTGRLFKKILPNGFEFKYLDYWGDETLQDFTDDAESVKKVEAYRSGALIKTLEYAPDGSTVVRVILPNGEESHVVEYWEGTDHIKVEDRYLSGVFVRRLEYDINGESVMKITMANGDVTAYYQNGNIKSFLRNSTGNIEEYYDENFYGNDVDGHGRGRVSLKLNASGSESRYLEYYPGTDTVKIEEVYQSGVLVRTIEYYSTGIKRSEVLVEPDIAGFIRHDYDPSGKAKTYTYQDGSFYEIYESGNYKSYSYGEGSTVIHYYDENFYGTDSSGFGNGRLSGQVYNFGQNEERYLEYWQGTDTLKIYEVYEAGNFVKRIELLEDGVTINKVTLPSGDSIGYYPSGYRKSDFTQATGLYTEYYDEDFFGGGVGRKLKEVYADGREFRYVKYWGNTAIARVKEFYQSGAYLKTVEYDPNGISEKKVTFANGDEYEYYFSGNLKSSFVGTVYQEYLDENYYGAGSDGHGRGRLSRWVEAETEIRYKNYFKNTDVAQMVEEYSEGVLQRTQTFDRSGRIQKEVYGDGSYAIFKYDLSGRLTRNTSYLKDGNHFLIQSDDTYSYGTRSFSSTFIDNLYSSEQPLRPMSALETHYLSNYPFQYNLDVTTLQKYTQYMYNAAGKRFLEVQDDKTFYYDLSHPGEQKLKTEKISSYELTSSGNSTRRFYSLDAKYASDGQTVTDSQEEKWVYQDNGRISRYEITVIKNRLLSSRKIYTYDTRGHVVEIQTFAFYASGNVKTERLEKARVVFEYKDENFDGEGKGRLAKKTNSNGTYETYGYWGNTDELTDIYYYRANNVLYSIRHFGRSVPDSSASALELSAFGGDGFFAMQDQKSVQRSSSSPIPVGAEKGHIDPLS